MALVKQRKLILIEDTCESLGTKWDSKQLGTFGDFGTFSLYYSHHITCGEGGVVTCQTEEDYNLLLCLRAHGWTRHQTNAKEIEQSFSNVDPRFLFINAGFNFRPMSIQAATASTQLVKLPAFVEARKSSYAALYAALKDHASFDIVQSAADAAWFGFAVILKKLFWHQLGALKSYLSELGIEHRPIISGNMARQPFNKLFGVDVEPSNYPGADIVHYGGLFIGLHSKPLTKDAVALLKNAFESFEWQAGPRILVTGGSGLLGHALQSHLNNETYTCKFLSSQDGDLRDYKQTERVFQQFHPTHVIHAAADVGGLYKNLNSNFDIGINNTLMNLNVIKCALKFEVHNLIAISSTCVFPEAQKSFSESQVQSGAPHLSNADYAMSKRTMHMHITKVRNTLGYQWNVLIPQHVWETRL